MQLPAFIKALPSLDVPFRDETVTTSAIRSDRGLMVIFEFHQDFSLPAHSHKAQWGTVIAGEVRITIDEVETKYMPGDSYTIPSGVIHAVSVTAGTKAIDIFEEPDRYPLKG
ncbi:cupin domain-containing protein [Yoonia sp.]|uniref:cupin domain-containing protein n=1 Tax=Yoonia sp. TaxID=2212373 RepID=UPI0025CD6BD9|nr:cupin domain-containing protein [Yoonia sp.]